MRQIIILLICLISVSGLMAQRYLPDQPGIQVTGGITDFNFKSDYHLGMAFSNYTKNGNRWVYGAEFLNKLTQYETIKIPVSQFTAEGGYYVNFLSDKGKNVFFSLGISALAGYETVNWGNKLLPDGARLLTRDRFVYGGALTFEIESYLSDRVVLLFNIRERLLWGTDTDQFHNQIGIGLKYILK